MLFLLELGPWVGLVPVTRRGPKAWSFMRCCRLDLVIILCHALLYGKRLFVNLVLFMAIHLVSWSPVEFCDMA